MSDQRNGGIGWTDCTWNFLRGCSKVSAGCAHCYAESMAARFSGPGMPFEGTIRNGKWSGEIRVVEEKLGDPLRWKKPRRVFVNSVSDVFHENVTNETIAAIFGVMETARRHTFQVLTKRPVRALDWFSNFDPATLYDYPGHPALKESHPSDFDYTWPLPNVHLLASCENQSAANERIPHLLACPAAVRGVSLEPLLGPIDLDRFLKRGGACECDQSLPAVNRCNSPKTPASRRMLRCKAAMRALDWVIVGCESGPRRRPCNLDWVSSIVDQCRGAGVPVFVKQLEINGAVTSDVETFPEWARVRMFPGDKY